MPSVAFRPHRPIIKVEIQGEAPTIGRTRIDARSVSVDMFDGMDEDALQGFVAACSRRSMVLKVYDEAILRQSRRTGMTEKRSAVLHPIRFTLHSNVPASIGLAAIISKENHTSRALARIIRAQAEDAVQLLVRTRNANNIALGPQIAEPDLVAYLMGKWAIDIADSTNGRHREACLHAGTQAFASFLDRYEFGHHISDLDVVESADTFAEVAYTRTSYTWEFTATRAAEITANELYRREPLAFRRASPTEIARRAVFTYRTLPDENIRRNANNALVSIRQNAASAARAKLTKIHTEIATPRDVLLDALSRTSCGTSIASVIGMVCAGTALYSREQAAHDAKVAARVTTILALAGAVVGFFPAASPAVGLAVTLGTALTNTVADSHVNRHRAVENAARRFASTVVLDRRPGYEEAGSIIQAAFNSIEGLV